jgi:hypothetical protein
MLSYLLADYLSKSDVLTLSRVNSFAHSSVPDSPVVRVFGKTVRAVGLARGVEARRLELGYNPEIPPPVVVRPEMDITLSPAQTEYLEAFMPPSAAELKAAGEMILPQRAPEPLAPAMW